MEIRKEQSGAQPGQVEQRDLEEINALSKGELRAEDVYVFSLRLCDNEVDRDFQRFDREALERLGELFVGKSGLFDHQWSAEGQTARIYRTEVYREDGAVTAAGDGLYYLKGWAYMLRSDKNADLIAEIEAGIKKEVSVGCSVGECVCSICGSATPCEHVPGRSYGGKLCYQELRHPTDAYEWSFVAVPAQRRAGVTKGYRQEAGSCLEHLLKSLSFGREVTLSPEQSGALGDYLDQLKTGAKLGWQYLEDLKKRVRSLALVCEEAGEAAAFSSLVEKMDLEELKAFEKSFETRLSGGPAPQLAPERNPSQPSPNGEFKI